VKRVTMPNFVAIGQTVVEIRRFLQGEGRPPSWICHVHVEVSFSILPVRLENAYLRLKIGGLVSKIGEEVVQC